MILLSRLSALMAASFTKVESAAPEKPTLIFAISSTFARQGLFFR
jgi:hypothetical protein